LQGIIDDYYDTFVERVSDGGTSSPSFVRDTEARIYLGEQAHDLDLVDHLGTRREIETELADRLDTDEVTVEEFEPDRPLMARVGAGVQQVAYAFGAGIAGPVMGAGSGCEAEAVVGLRCGATVTAGHRCGVWAAVQPRTGTATAHSRGRLARRRRGPRSNE